MKKVTRKKAPAKKVAFLKQGESSPMKNVEVSRPFTQMLVRTPEVNINIGGKSIPEDLIELIKKRYGKKVKYIEKEEDELISIRETSWYKNHKKKMTPGKYIKAYRGKMGLTQEQLGEKLGNISRQNISSMELGKRTISKKIAKILANLFNTSVEKFI